MPDESVETKPRVRRLLTLMMGNENVMSCEQAKGCDYDTRIYKVFQHQVTHPNVMKKRKGKKAAEREEF